MARKFTNGIQIPTGSPSSGKVWTATDTAGNGNWTTVSGSGGPGGGPTLMVAAAGAPASVISRADYACDGTADNVEIQAAINTAQTAGGGRVVLSAGTFTLSAKLQITASHISLEGQGNGTIITLANAVNDNVLNITGSGVIEVKVKNLRIDGNKANQTSGDGIYVSTAWTSGTNDTQHSFEDLQILNCKNNGFEVAASGDTRVLQFNRCRIRKCDGNGWYMPAPSATDSTFYDCIAETIGLSGFYIGTLNSHFTDCKTFYCGSAGGNTHGFYILGYNNYFTQCEAQDNYQSGFYVTDTGGDATYGAQGNTFHNCIADSNNQNANATYGCGMQIKRASNTQIIGGIYMTRPYPNFTQRVGISLEGTTTGTIIMGALLTGNTTQYSDTSSGTNYPMFNNGYGPNKITSDLYIPDTKNIYMGDGTPYIYGSGKVIGINAANNSFHFDNFAEIFFNGANPNLSLYSASNQTLGVVNLGGGTANLSVQNKTTTNSLRVSGGTPGIGKVLTDDGTGAGIAVWSTPTGGSSFAWNEVTTTSQTAAINNGYIANNAGLVTVTLPATAAQGSIIKIAGKGAGGWRLSNTTGVTTYYGNTTTTAGTGSISSTQQRDCIELLCITANTEWQVVDSLGNLTVV